MWLFNVALAAFVGLAYLDGESLPQVAHVRVFAYLGLVSTLATLALVPQAFLWLAARTSTGQRIYPALQALVWMLFQLAIVVDTRVWGLFRYHFNSAAWNLITSKGSEDSYRLGPSVWLVAGGLALALGLVQALVWRMLCRWGAPRPFVEGESRFVRHARPLRRPAWIVATLVLLAVCVEKSIYASAELARDPHVAAVSRAFPLYPRVSVVPMLPEPLAGEVASGHECVVFREGARLDYPHAQPVLAPGIPRPNVLILVVDSWRADSLDAATTPRLEQFSRSARRFADHTSGGNGTRFGVFSMLYGLHGSYWWPVLEAGASPVLLDTLLEAGYDAQVFSAASMDYPEFRHTAWARIPQNVHDDFGELRSSERDRLAAQACAEWWRTRDAAQPFFAFVLLDSAHQQYDFPEDEAPFVPYARDLDYVELAGSRDPALVERVHNRYRNALRHADKVAGGLLDELAACGQLEHTLVVVTGDHGEEFAEHGYWGHTGNFTASQVQVPLLLRGPGVPVGVEQRPTTHADLPATLLELVGADPALRPGWTLGSHLLDPDPTRLRVAAGWEDVGLLTADAILRVPREQSAGLGVSVWNGHWRLLDDPRTVLEAQQGALDRLAEECARFLEPR